jgi:prevent-host-death family protein
MQTVITRELKARLSEYLHRAESGARIVVLRDGAPVAVLVPCSDLPALDSAAPLVALAARGLVRLPERTGAYEPAALPGSRESASQQVSDDRR